MEINRFTGATGFLSNFYVNEPIVFDGVEFLSAEHLFNALKTRSASEAQYVIEAKTAADAKARGRTVTLRENWDSIERYTAMRRTLGAKFFGSPLLREMLCWSGDRPLIEGNTWHDNVWGDCTCGRPACQTPGENHLGKLLMELRSDLQKWI